MDGAREDSVGFCDFPYLAVVSGVLDRRCALVADVRDARSLDSIHRARNDAGESHDGSALLGYPYVDDVYWTLFVELKFYFLLWALSVTGQMSRIETWLYAWLGVTVLCFVFEMPAAVRSMALYRGCFFFLIRARGSTAARWIAVPVCLVLAVQGTTNMMPAFVHREDVTRDALNEATGLIVLFFVLFAAVALRRGMQVKFAKTIVFLGMLTYPLYLLHNIGKVTLLAWIAPSSPIIALAVTVAFSLGLSALLVRALEPWRKRLVEQLASAYATTRARLPATGL